MIILDTNVLSEMMKASPSFVVQHWLGAQRSPQVYTTAITQAEILYGLELVPKGKRRVALQAAVDAMFADDFADRVLAFDCDAARIFPIIAAGRRRLGRPISQFDAQIAAIARSRGAAIATRNTTDFDDCGVEVINPWSPA